MTSPDPIQALRERLLKAAKRADWVQVVLNGGPPCFHLADDGDFCLRAERWAGHGTTDREDHPFVSLADLLEALASPALGETAGKKD